MNHYIDLKILENLSEKDTPLKIFFNKDKLEIFKSRDVVSYEKQKDKLLTLDDIKKY